MELWHAVLSVLSMYTRLQNKLGNLLLCFLFLSGNRLSLRHLPLLENTLHASVLLLQ